MIRYFIVVFQKNNNLFFENLIIYKVKEKYNNLFLVSTDTVAGLGCFNKDDIALLYELKNRPLDKKIIILVGSLEQARSFPQWNNQAEQLASQYWPGSVSLIVNDQGFRMPDLAPLQQFLLQNGPAYVTSANLSGQAPLDFAAATKVFPFIKNKYNFGKGSNIPSKIIDVKTLKELR